jgi:hypothetical protein
MVEINGEKILKFNCIASLIQDLLKEQRQIEKKNFCPEFIRKIIKRLIARNAYSIIDTNFSFLIKYNNGIYIFVNSNIFDKVLDVNVSTNCDSNDKIKNAITDYIESDTIREELYIKIHPLFSKIASKNGDLIPNLMTIGIDPQATVVYKQSLNHEVGFRCQGSVFSILTTIIEETDHA